MHQSHFSALEKMYMEAPIQKMYPGISIAIQAGKSRISLPVLQQYFHSAQSVHGSVYFKLLDDAAYFAAASLVADCFLLTVEYAVRFSKRVESGVLIAEGICHAADKKLIKAESVLLDANGDQVAAGTGTFAKSDLPLNAESGYYL